MKGHQQRALVLRRSGVKAGEGRAALGLQRIVATVSPGNTRSLALLRRLGLDEAGVVQLPGKDEELLLFETPADPTHPGRPSLATR